jgi:glutathione synthase/RimK-type ligase-like ATP-grasp enzyme
MRQIYASAEILFSEAERQGLAPVWETKNGLFSIKDQNKNVYIYYTKLHLNSQLGAWICQEKVLARTFLQKEGFPSIPFLYSNQKHDINRFFDAHHPIIAKPILGERAENVQLIRERKDLKSIDLKGTIFERFIEGTEYRYLVLQGKIIAVQRKVLDPTPALPWRKRVENLERKNWDRNCIQMSERIATLLHMGFIAVDVIQDTSGTPWILELNSMPGLYPFHHPHDGAPLNVATKLLQAILKQEDNNP